MPTLSTGCAILMAESLIYSITIGVFAGLAAGYLGSLMVLEKMSLVGDALSHVALPGFALGLLYHFNPFIGAFSFLFVSAIAIWHLGRVTRLGFETLVGAVFTLSLAIGILITPEPELLEALFGNITMVETTDVVITIIVSSAAIALTRVIYGKTVLSLISEEMATSVGIDVARTNLLFLLLVSTVVAVGIKITGTLLVGFLVVVPAAAARSLSASLFRYSLLSSVFGAMSSVFGIIVASNSGLPPGPMVVLSGIMIFLVAVVVNWMKKIS